MTEEEIDGQVQKIAESLDRLLRLSGGRGASWKRSSGSAARG
jgi:hypothetical protein